MAVDDVAFRRGVDLGVVLELTAKIAYTKGPYMQVRLGLEAIFTLKVRVYGDIFDEKTNERYTSDTFHFTFKTRDNSNVGVLLCDQQTLT